MARRTLFLGCTGELCPLGGRVSRFVCSSWVEWTGTHDRLAAVARCICHCQVESNFHDASFFAHLSENRVRVARALLIRCAIRGYRRTYRSAAGEYPAWSPLGLVRVRTASCRGGACGRAAASGHGGRDCFFRTCPSVSARLLPEMVSQRHAG